MKILFTSTHTTSFISEDLAILRRHCEVEYRRTRGILSLITLPSAIRRAECTFTWFASVYAAFVVFFARVWKKPSFIVVGGVDVAKLPEIGYGIWLSPWKSLLVRYALRAADRVLVVDPSLQREAMLRAQYNGANIRYVPTGYDAERWVPAGEKEAFVLTVAKCEDDVRLKVKGIPHLLDAARRMPEVQFVVIGVAEHVLQHLAGTAPPNVSIMPFADHERLFGFYQRAKVYCQPSLSEGLPNSLCEAMLCECIPVGTNVGGIPTVLRTVGFLVPSGDSDALVDALRRALAAPDEIGKAARRLIAASFSSARREAELLHEIRRVCATHSLHL
ncbi:MAG: glycosyl transferase family 1 [Ignavibacteria bacterium]